LEREISLLGWTRSGSGRAIGAAALDEVRSGLRRADLAMAMFVQAGPDLYALVAAGQDLMLRRVGDAAVVAEQVRRVRADLDVLAQPHLPASLRATVHTSFVRSLNTLDNQLLRPLSIDGRAIVIVSTGLLGQLPWGQLASLFEVPLVVAPSATTWLAARNRRRSRADTVVALAGPDLERGVSEVIGVGEAWSNVDTLVGASADRHALSAALARANVVHVAAHGVHQTENPLFSSVRLAGGDMFAHELDQTRRTAEHVILSACELGLATVRPGDEALGLTSVLLHLGSKSVVAGVARVGDEIAAETMTAYHRALAGGADSAAALATALARNDADHPAPFVNFGAAWTAPKPRNLAG
jgi:hypothetical protein